MNTNCGLNILIGKIIQNHVNLKDAHTFLEICISGDDYSRVDLASYTDNEPYSIVDWNLIIVKKENKYVRLKEGTKIKLSLSLTV